MLTRNHQHLMTGFLVLEDVHFSEVQAFLRKELLGLVAQASLFAGAVEGDVGFFHNLGLISFLIKKHKKEGKLTT